MNKKLLILLLTSISVLSYAASHSNEFEEAATVYENADPDVMPWFLEHEGATLQLHCVTRKPFSHNPHDSIISWQSEMSLEGSHHSKIIVKLPGVSSMSRLKKVEDTFYSEGHVSNTRILYFYRVIDSSRLIFQMDFNYGQYCWTEDTF